jgi:hypothetical protein
MSRFERFGGSLVVVWALACAVAPLCGSGCGRRSSGPSGQPGFVAPTVSSDDELRQRLQGIADSGFAGSALGGLPEFIDKHANKKELMAEYKKLQAATTSDQIKTAAKAMLGKL